MRKVRTLAFAALAVLLSACQVEPIPFINFDMTMGLDQSSFKVTSTKCSEYEVPAELEAAAEAEAAVETKTTAVNAQNVLQKLLKRARHRKLIEVAGIYTSKDHNGDDIVLSGKIILPADRKPIRYIVCSHFTINSNAECPSMCFPLEGVLATLGYAMVLPDYEGFGVTVDRTHPYLVMEQTSVNVVDMYLAVKKLLANTKYAPDHDDIYLVGYSQGGATTMAVQHKIETSHPDIKIRGVYAGGGPYDIKATYSSYVDSNHCGYPYGVAIVLNGMIKGNNLHVDVHELLQPRIAEHFDEWYESKKYTTGQVNLFIGTKVASEILNAKGMDATSPEVAELYKAMTENSVISLGWTPAAPVYMFHSMDDDTVPFVNATKAKEKWSDANIQYNFGHYGNHQLGCGRFLGTVIRSLNNAQAEEEEYASE